MHITYLGRALVAFVRITQWTNHTLHQKLRHSPRKKSRKRVLLFFKPSFLKNATKQFAEANIAVMVYQRFL